MKWSVFFLIYSNFYVVNCFHDDSNLGEYKYEMRPIFLILRLCHISFLALYFSNKSFTIGIESEGCHFPSINPTEYIITLS